jgi:DNA-binding response OmpR family regulator
VLLDLLLRGAPGSRRCAKRLRQRSDVPVIVPSAKDTGVDKVVSLELGADDYMTKPFSWRELAMVDSHGPENPSEKRKVSRPCCYMPSLSRGTDNLA